VAEIVADLPDRDAVLEQVGREAVPQSVTSRILVDPGRRNDRPQGCLNAGHAHGFCGDLHGCLQGAGTLLPSAADSGEEPLRIAVELPVTAELCDHPGSDGHLPVLPALPVDDADDPASRVNVLWTNADGLADPETAVVDQGEDGLEAVLAAGCENGTDILAGEHERERTVTADGELPPELPVEAEEVPVEHPQRHEGLIERRGPEMLRIAQVDEMIEHIPLLETIEPPPRMAVRELADLPQILLLAASAE